MKTKLLSIFFCSLVVGASLGVSGKAITSGNVKSFVAREANEVKIAKRFIAGVWVNRTIQSAERTAAEVPQQNPSPAASPSSEAAQQKGRERIAEKRAEMTKRAAERQAKNAQRIAEKKADSAKRAEKLRAKRIEQTQKRQAASARRAAAQKARSENLKAARTNSAKRAAQAEARATKRNAAREAAQAKRAAAADGRKGPADGTFRFLSSRMNANATTVVKGAPYSALATTEYVQKFVDGNQIVRRNEASYYRDSEGRTRVEQKLNTIGKWTASGEAPRIITIGDPVFGAYYSLDPRTRTAVKDTGLGKRLQEQSLRKTREAGQEKTTSTPEQATSKVSADGRKKTESLGRQRIEGVEAEGKRVTTIIPAGEIGNALPIETTDESWYSPELKTVVMTKHHDPRSGDTIYRLTNITRREPDHSLFQVPPDYTIVDRSERRTAPPKTKTETEKQSRSQIF